MSSIVNNQNFRVFTQSGPFADLPLIFLMPHRIWTSVDNQLRELEIVRLTLLEFTRTDTIYFFKKHHMKRNYNDSINYHNCIFLVIAILD